MEGLAARLAPVPRGFGLDDGEIRAAAAVVLAPLVDGACVLLMERTLRDEDPWSGHVAFPGGRREPGDADPAATARREAWEEVGLALPPERCLGALSAWSPMNRPHLRVLPVVFGLPNPIPTGTSAEAAASFWIPLATLRASQTRATRSTSQGPLEVPAFGVGPRIIWGFTYRVLVELLGLIGAAP